MLTTNFPADVTNVHADKSSLGELPVINPTMEYRYFNDFLYYDAAEWNVSGTASVEILDSKNGAIEIFQNDPAESTFEAVSKSFQLKEGKNLWFKIGLFTRFPSDDLDDTDFEFGIRNDTSNGLFFLYTANELNIRARNLGVTTEKVLVSTTSLFPIANSLQEFAFHYDGANKISVYIDNSIVGSLETDAVNLTLLNAFFISINPPDSDQVNLGVDYVFIAQER